MADTLTKILADDRAVLKIAGPEAADFLQGLITNDIAKVSGEKTIYAALLTPQGKFLYDFFIVDAGGEGGEPVFLFECEKARAGELKKRLTMYKLRAKATIEDVSDDWAVLAVIGSGEADWSAYGGAPDEAGRSWQALGGYVFVDPRLAGLGLRALVPAGGVDACAGATGTMTDYLRHRLALGVPQGGVDIEPEKSFLLESNFEEMNGVDFKKGCYVGQELTARTKHRGSIRRRILQVSVDGALPEHGAEITAGERQIGTVLSGLDTTALAIIRTDRLEEAQAQSAPLTAGEATLTVHRPGWLEG